MKLAQIHPFEVRMFRALVAVLVLAASFSTLSRAAAADCTAVKLQAADALARVCGDDQALSSEESAGLDDLVASLTSACDARAGEILQRGILYKSLDLNDNCSAKAQALATSLTESTSTAAVSGTAQ